MGKKGMPKFPPGAKIAVTTPSGSPPALGANGQALAAPMPARRPMRRRPPAALPGRAMRRF
jgi:hypothetical protein